MKKTMKAIVACITCLTMAASLTACSGDSGTSGSGSTAAPAPAAESQGGEGEGVQAPSVDIDRATEFVTIATGPTSGIYYPIGGAFATVLGNAGYKTPRRRRELRLRILT